MFLESKNNFRALLLVLAGCVGIFWFYYSFAQFDSLSTIKTSYTLDEALAKSDSVLNTWQNLPNSFNKDARLLAHNGLIDSLQTKLGDKKFHEVMAEKTSKNFPLFYWNIEKYFNEETGKLLSTTNITPAGEIISFEMSKEALDIVNPFNMEAIKHSFGLNFSPSFENKATQDSLLSILLNFQKMENSMALSLPKITELSRKLGSDIQTNSIEMYTQERIWEGVNYYIKNSYWNRYAFNKDSLNFVVESGSRILRLYLSSADSVLGFTPSL